MQTFLPYSDFVTSAKVLDYRRLGKQRVEAMQLINILEHKNTSKGWVNHSARKMWIGYTDALKSYCNVMIKEWKSRGYKNTMQLYIVNDNINYPPWFGNVAFHASHRAALLHKNFDYYSKYGWSEKPELNYVWPTN